jgi:hypothetical protein
VFVIACKATMCIAESSKPISADEPFFNANGTPPDKLKGLTS